MNPSHGAAVCISVGNDAVHKRSSRILIAGGLLSTAVLAVAIGLLLRHSQQRRERMMFWSSVRHLPWQDGPQFSQMGPNDRTTIQFKSVGCFHGFEHRVELTGTGPATAYVSVVRSVDRSPPRSGTIKLSAEDASRLDQLLQHYRTATDRGCTTRDYIVIQWHREGQETRRETLIDTTCDTLLDASLLTVPELTLRLD